MCAQVNIRLALHYFGNIYTHSCLVRGIYCWHHLGGQNLRGLFEEKKEKKKRTTSFSENDGSRNVPKGSAPREKENRGTHFSFIEEGKGGERKSPTGVYQ